MCAGSDSESENDGDDYNDLNGDENTDAATNGTDNMKEHENEEASCFTHDDLVVPTTMMHCRFDVQLVLRGGH